MTRYTGRLRPADVHRRLSENSLARNSGYIMATTIVNSGLGFLFWTLAAHIYSTATVGLAAAVISAMVVTSLACTFGTDATLIQSLPTRTAGADWSLTLNSSLVLATLTSLVGAVAAGVLIPELAHSFAPVAGVYAIAFVIGTITWTITTVLDAAFVAERTAKFMFWRNGLLSAGKLVLLALSALIAGKSSIAIFIPWVAASVISLGVGLVILIPRLGRDYRPVLKGAASYLRRRRASLAGHHVISLSGALPPLLLPVIVATRLSPTDNAYFYATWMVGGVFFVVSPAVASALFAEGSHSRDTVGAKARSSARLIAVLLAPITVGYLLAGRSILSLFGSSYAKHGWVVLLLLLASAVPDGVTNIYVAVMRVTARLRLAALLNAGIAVTTIAGAWFLLPVMGISGAAVAWLAAQCLGTLVVTAHVAVERLRAARGHAPANA